MATDAQSLLTQAQCYMCMGVSLAQALELALLAQIVTNGSTGGGSSNTIVSTTDPVNGTTAGTQGQFWYNSTAKNLWISSAGGNNSWVQLI